MTRIEMEMYREQLMEQIEILQEDYQDTGNTELLIEIEGLQDELESLQEDSDSIYLGDDIERSMKQAGLSMNDFIEY